jgi:hypothetical protein
MLNDLTVPETEQIERDRGCAVTTNAFVSGMQQYESSVHKRAIYRYIGGGRARYCGKRLHSGKTIGQIRVMLHERLGKIPIDCGRIFLTKDIDHGLASVRAQGVGGCHGPALL